MSKNKNNNKRANTLSTLSVFSSFTRDVLVNNHYAKVHSIFLNGFNLILNGELIYVSYHQKGMLSATGMSIDKDVFDALLPYLEPDLHVRIRKEQLMFYTRPHIFTVDLVEKQVKNLKVIPISRNAFEKITFKKQLEQLNVFEHSGFSKNAMLLSILEKIQMSQEVTMNDIRQLIGAGIGLTPSGDDFLQGLIFMEQTLGDLPYIQNLVEEMLKERSTTMVSLSYYQAIFAGYGNEPLVLLMNAVKVADEKKMREALSYLKEYGETSGYDLLLGMYTYLDIL